MMDKYRPIGSSVFGGGGAAGSMLANQGCLGSCSGCFGCVAFSGVLVSLALFKTFYRKKEGDQNELAAGDN